MLSPRPAVSFFLFSLSASYACCLKAQLYLAAAILAADAAAVAATTVAVVALTGLVAAAVIRLLLYAAAATVLEETLEETPCVFPFNAFVSVFCLFFYLLQLYLLLLTLHCLLLSASTSFLSAYITAYIPFCLLCTICLLLSVSFCLSLSPFNCLLWFVSVSSQRGAEFISSPHMCPQRLSRSESPYTAG